ncbi:hypothetical protein FNF29_05939 [Cafeteria roenbergensis]|uniref:Peptidase S54 rhomboid domain-containing protein n=1 Tax=Cafeteria roenbergensis TaxID=33653 RepID=A0A5A8C905_CAFRO|nr:hypothetical protein FNF29_05939 [Cafeteria roenbergensis]|eukprot:KAA0149553.1 hypothetical protein FNF29_05939 [Cafeteria roenbergensis]
MQFAAAAPVSVAGCALAVVAAFVNWNWRYKAEDLAFDADAVQRRGQWYRAFTAPLAHSSLAHLVISVLGWTSAAGLVELTTGSVRMLLLTLVLLGVSYAAQCAAAAAYGQAARSLSLAARFGNAADRERERSRPLLGLGLTLPALIWSGALGFWGLSGFVSPMLALATGSPFIDVSQLAKQYVAAPTHPAMPDAGLGGHSGSADVALLPGSADPPLNSASLDERPAAGAGAGADATVDGPAPPGDTPAAPESASAPAGLLPGAGAAAFLVVFPCSMAGVTLTLSHNSIVAVVPAALVGAAAAASGAVVAASGIDAVDAVAHSRWLYYRLLAGETGF